MLSTHKLNFHTIGTGTTPTLTFGITNAANSLLVGNVDASSLPSTLSLTAGSGPFSLTHSQSLKVTVLAAPTQAGPFSGTIGISSTDPKRPVVGLLVAGVAKAGKMKVPVAQNFGRVKIGKMPTKTFKVINQGLGLLQGEVGGLNPPFQVTAGGSSFSLLAGHSVSVTIEFVPSSTQKQSATLTISSNDPVRPSVAILVSGRGK